MTIQDYLEKIPRHLKDALLALGDENRIAIFLLLLLEDEENYSQIMKELGYKDSSTFNYHIKKLMQSGLITRFYKKSPGTLDRSFYTPSNFGKTLFDRLLVTMEEPYMLLDSTSSDIKPIQEFIKTPPHKFPTQTPLVGPISSRAEINAIVVEPPKTKVRILA